MRKFLTFFISAFILIFGLSFNAYSASVSAKSACAIESSSKEVYFEKNSNEKMSMASTTKIMTAIIVIENSKLDDLIKIDSRSVGIEGSSIYLKEGECLSVEDLLYALLLESANDASIALAIHCAGSVECFVDLMNKKTNELELSNTHFTNPHGLYDENHYTTAHDLAKIALYAMNLPVFYDIVSTYKKVILPNEENSRVLINHNKLLRTYDGAIGVKTGFTTNSGRCLVSCAEKDGARLVCVTLDAPNDWSDHTYMLNLGFTIYEGINLANCGDYVLDIPVINGKKQSILCTNYDSLNATVKKESKNISAEFEVNQLLCAPIKQGDLVGKIIFKNNDSQIAFLNLYALENVKAVNYKKSFFERIFG